MRRPKRTPGIVKINAKGLAGLDSTNVVQPLALVVVLEAPGPSLGRCGEIRFTGLVPVNPVRTEKQTALLCKSHKAPPD